MDLSFGFIRRNFHEQFFFPIFFLRFLVLRLLRFACASDCVRVYVPVHILSIYLIEYIFQGNSWNSQYSARIWSGTEWLTVFSSLLFFSFWLFPGTKGQRMNSSDFKQARALASNQFRFFEAKAFYNIEFGLCRYWMRIIILVQVAIEKGSVVFSVEWPHSNFTLFCRFELARNSIRSVFR